MVEPPKSALNAWWCAEHWQPYAADESAARRAAHRMAERLIRQRSFAIAVEQEYARARGGLTRAVHAVVENWANRNGRPLCCLLGEVTMEDIRNTVAPSARERSHDR